MRFWRECARRRVIREAFQVSLLVGTALNLINHPGLLTGHALTLHGVGELALNYLVPFAVSSHGQATAALRSDQEGIRAD